VPANDMTNVAKFPNPHQIEVEACAWIAQLDGKTPSREDLAAFREWVNRSPQHREEIARLAGLWGDLNVLTELALPSRRSARPIRNHFLLGTAIIAVFAVLITVVALLHVHPTMSAAAQNQLYSTRVGEQKSVLLADGTKILLNTDSRVQTTYSPEQREVHLLQGEAYFEVAHNAALPFLVYAGANVVRAVGTAFTVHLQKQDVEVVVTDGTVEISVIANVSDVTPTIAPGKPMIRLADLKAGQSAAFNQEVESIQSIEPPEIQRRLSWREGVLTFSGEPLEQVVDEVSRYTPVTIVISDPAIRKIRIGGYFKVGETDAMLEALETSFGVRVKRVNDKLVYLAAK
jgi:transmembrane sensor